MNVQRTPDRCVQHCTFVLMVYVIIRIIVNMLTIIAFTVCLRTPPSAAIVLMGMRLMRQGYVRAEALHLLVLKAKLVRTEYASKNHVYRCNIVCTVHQVTWKNALNVQMGISQIDTPGNVCVIVFCFATMIGYASTTLAHKKTVYTEGLKWMDVRSAKLRIPCFAKNVITIWSSCWHRIYVNA